MIELSFANDLGRWLLTYLVHSTILLASAWLLTRKVRKHAEALWTAALLGGLLTTSLQVGLGYGSILGTLAMPQSAAAIETRATGGETVQQPPTLLLSESRRETRARQASTPLRGVGPISTAPIESPRRLASSWSVLLAGFWVFGAVLLAVRLGIQALRFRRQLIDRTEVKNPSLLERLSQLIRKGAGPSVRLTSSPKARVPFATGWLRPEICLPNRVLTELEDDTQEAILAHELAHLERRDPLWQLVHELVAAVFFVQPLNRVACLKIREQAELSCDRRAADLTGRPVALARVLTEIATWFHSPSLQPAPGVVSGAGGNLSRRVSRLLDPEHNPKTAWHGLALAASLLLAVATLAPTFSAQAEVPSPPPVPAPPVPTPVVALTKAPAAAPPAPMLLTAPSFTLLTGIPESPPEAPTPSAPVPAESPSPAPAQSAAIAAVAVAPAVPPAPVAHASPARLQEPSAAEQEADAEDSDDEDSDTDEAEAEIEAFEEELEAQMEELGAVFEEMEEIFEEELEAAMEELEAVLEGEMEGFEEEIEAQMEAIEEEIEKLAEEHEERIEAAAEELENTQDEARRKELEAEIRASSRELGQLGAIIGEAFAQFQVGTRLSSIAGPFAQIAAEAATQHAKIAQVIAQHMRAFSSDGRAPTDEEMANLRREMERVRAEMAPRREEIARLREEMRGKLEPLREQMQELREKLREDLERWREENDR